MLKRKPGNGRFLLSHKGGAGSLSSYTGKVSPTHGDVRNATAKRAELEKGRDGLPNRFGI